MYDVLTYILDYVPLARVPAHINSSLLPSSQPHTIPAKTPTKYMFSLQVVVLGSVPFCVSSYCAQ